MISARDHFIQLKFIHRAYYTPVRLAKMYPGTSPLCNRCSASPFWEQVVGALNEFGDWSLGLDPTLALLGSTEDVVAISILRSILR